MKFIVSGKNIEITEPLREKITKKLGKLDRFFHHEVEAHVTMSVEKNRQIVEVTIPFNGIILRGEAHNEDMYASIDKVIDIVESQIRRNKTRLSKRLHEGLLRKEYFALPNEHEEEKDFRLVRTKKFTIKPMNLDEAILQMNLLGHEFFMFSNSSNNKINVVYKRKDGNYGLLDPES